MSADTAGLRASELTKLLTHELGLRTRTSLFGGSSTDDTNIRVMSDRRTTTAFSYKRDSKFDPAMAAESLLQVPTSNDDVESLDITDFFGSSQYDKERAEWAEKEAKKSVEPGVMVARLTVEGAKSAALPIVHIEDADLQRLRLRDLNTSGENVNTRAAHRHAPKLFAQAAEDFIRNSSSSQSDIVFSVANESYPLQDVSAHSPWPEPEISGARRRPSVYSRRRSLSHEEVRTDNVPIHVDTLSVDEEEDLIPAEVFDLSTMELKPDHPYLDISCRNLSHFPNFTQRFCTLVELHIVNNWITVVPEGGFRSLVALQVLDLSQNLFSEVPKELRALPELRELYIRENRLEIIPLEFRDCKTLEICDFSRNRLRIIDADVFYGMSSLRTLDLSHNTLETLPSSLGTLGGTLTILNLAGNPFNIEYARLVAPLILSTFAETSTPGFVVGGDPQDPETVEFGSRDQMAPRQALTELEGPKRRIKSLPPDGLTQEQMDRLQILFGNQRQKRHSSYTPSLEKSEDERFPSETEESVELEYSPHDATPTGSVRSSHSAVRARLGSVGFFGQSSFKYQPEQAEPQEPEPPLEPSTSPKKNRFFGLPKRKPTSSSSATSAKRTPSIHTTATSNPGTFRKMSLKKRGRVSSLLTKSTQSSKGNTGLVSREQLLRLLRYLLAEREVDPRLNGTAAEVFIPSERLRAMPEEEALESEERAKRAAKLKKKQTPERRMNVVKEILSTERTYVDQLKALVEVYINQIEERGLLSSQEVNAMFSNVRNILAFHEGHLLPALEAACSKSQQLGKAFLDGAPFLRMYSVYYNNFDSANNLVRGLDSNAPATTSSALGASPGVSGPGSFARLRILVAESAANKAMSKRFREFMHEVRNHPRHTQNSLQSFLILPVQRLPRYKLLLDELFECTPSDHPDYEPLKQAREEVRCRVQECNEKKREWEAREQGLHVLLKVKIRDWSARAAVVNHVKPGRRFIRDGLVRVVKCLEPAGLVEEDEQRIDPLMACGGKRDRFRQIFIGGLVETRFGFKGSSLEDGDTIGPEQLITHGLTRTTGKEFKLFLFSDVLCWCKRKGTADGEFDLVCGVELGTDDMAVELIESDQGGGPANIEFGAFLRIRNAQSIVYLGGTVAEMSSWYAAIMDGR